MRESLISLCCTAEGDGPVGGVTLPPPAKDQKAREGERRVRRAEEWVGAGGNMQTLEKI